MRNLPRPRSHIPPPSAGRGLTQSRRAWVAHPRLQLISDGVIAGYIHDISIRHGSRSADAGPRRPRGDRR